MLPLLCWTAGASLLLLSLAVLGFCPTMNGISTMRFSASGVAHGRERLVAHNPPCTRKTVDEEIGSSKIYWLRQQGCKHCQKKEKLDIKLKVETAKTRVWIKYEQTHPNPALIVGFMFKFIKHHSILTSVNNRSTRALQFDKNFGALSVHFNFSKMILSRMK